MDRFRSLASSLNQDCACYSLDVEALHQTLQADSVLSAWWPHWQNTHAHLFSATGLFVSLRHLQAMREAVRVLHAAMSLQAWREQVLALAPPVARTAMGPQGVFMGYDFHLTEAGPQLIEVNTNAGGAMLSLALTRAQHACCDAARAWLRPATETATLEQHWLEMFAHEWALQRPGESFVPARGPARTLAIVDEAPAGQYLYPEFLLFRDLLQRAGVDAVIAAPQALAWTGGELQYQGRRIDMVYLRLTDFYLEASAHAALREAWQSGACVFTPNPEVHALHANKRHLVTHQRCALAQPLGLVRIPAGGAGPVRAAHAIAHV